MEQLQSIGIQIHLVNGLKRTFHQDNPSYIEAICKDLDTKLFSRPSLIIEGDDEVTSFPGHCIVGVSILSEPLPDFFYDREQMTKSVVTEISEESFLKRRNQDQPKTPGVRSNVLSEIVFTSGQHLFIEFNEIAIGGFGERAELHKLFTNPALACRRLFGGFSLWNTAQMVSWTHYPKLETPDNSWRAEAVVEASSIPDRITSML